MSEGPRKDVRTPPKDRRRPPQAKRDADLRRHLDRRDAERRPVK